MLRVGLSGGIGSGKSSVSRQLARLGAVVVDSDVIAREIVAPGTPALAHIVQEFGSEVLQGQELDRTALGSIIFADPAARRALEAITHPRIAARTQELFEAAPARAVVVHDVPLLVEKSMGAAYHLVVIVAAEEDVRLRRLIDARGMDEDQARARMASQAVDAARRAAADVWLDNSAGPSDLASEVHSLWTQRLRPFEHNLRHRMPVRRADEVQIRDPDPTWPAQAERLASRLRYALGEVALAVEHTGPTSITDRSARDIIDLDVTISASLPDDPGHPDPLNESMARAGFVGAVPARPDDGGLGGGPDPGGDPQLFLSADPARMAQVHVALSPPPPAAAAPF